MCKQFLKNLFKKEISQDSSASATRPEEENFFNKSESLRPYGRSIFTSRHKAGYADPSRQRRDGFRHKNLIIFAVGLLLLLGLLISGWKLFSESFKPKEVKGTLMFNLEATKADTNGITSDTKFTLKSSLNLSKSEVEKLIKFSPEAKFSVKKKNLGFNFIRFALAQTGGGANFISAYEIQPAEPLKEDEIYKIYTATSTGVNLDHTYSWAFQVKAPFQVIEAFPGKEATDVPINSGIEITFNREGLISPEQFFKINPETEGKFSVKGEKLIFVPKSLKEKTIYTVTIKKDLKIEGSDDALTEDYIFSFETSAKEYAGQEKYFGWQKDFQEFTPGKKIVPEVFGRNLKSADLEISIYKFLNGDNFISSYVKQINRPFSWAEFNKNENYYKPEKEEKILSFKPVILERNYTNVLEIPQNLEEGYYLLDAILDGVHKQSWMQVTPVAHYYSLMNGRGLVWLYNFNEKKPLENAKIYFFNKTEQKDDLGISDKDGLTQFNTPADLKNNDNQDYNSQANGPLFLKVENGLKNTYILLRNTDLPIGNLYWDYLATDRYAYQTNDAINFWGIAKGRATDLREKKVTVGIYQYSEDLLFSQDVLVSPFDTIQGKIDFKGLTPGVYQVNVKLGKDTIASANFEVLTYAKPAYQITVTPSKENIFTGEKVDFKVKASFFDNTPVAGLELDYYTNWNDGVSGELVLDKNGEGVVSYAPEYYFIETKDDDGTYYPQNLEMSFSPALGEEGDISGSGNVLVFGPNLYLQAFTTKKAGNSYELKAKLNKISINQNLSDENAYSDFIGEPAANYNLNAEIIKITYVQVLDREYYDPIDKVTKKAYRYDRQENKIEDLSGTTNGAGEWVFNRDLPDEKGSFYKIVFTGADQAGKKLKRSIYATNFYNGASNDFYLSLNIGDGKYEEQYLNNDEIKIEAKTYGEEKPVDNRILFYRYQNDMAMSVVKNENNFSEKFSDSFSPSVSYRAVILGPYGFKESNDITASLKKESKKLNIDLNPDKNGYHPGEEARININVSDLNKQGKQAEVNVAVVDEALFHILPYNFSENILDTLYANIYNYPVTDSSDFGAPKAGAEMGGCFASGTLIKMADGSEKAIEKIKIGDQILTFKNEKTPQVVRATVQGISTHLVKELLVINNELKVTPEHKIYISGRWDYAGDIKLGDILINSQNEKIIVRTISQEIAGNIPVYNIVVNQYHTYFADNLYVHNAEKGGGARTNFVDVPLFKSVATDKQGKAEINFKTPDNITSWRVSAKAYAPETMEAGEAEKLVSVSLPFFADAVISKTYLVGDKPVIKLRAYGTDYKSDLPVEFSVKSESLNLGIKQVADKGEIYIPLGEMKTEGEYKIIIGAKQGNLTDALEKKIKVVKNYFRKIETTRYDLRAVNGAQIKHNEEGFTNLYFIDKGKGKFYPSLASLAVASGIRVDQIAPAYIAQKLLATYYNGPAVENNLDLSAYLKENGGVSLFPYSDANLELSAKLADIIPEFIYKDRQVMYFQNALTDEKADLNRISKSLYGLASLNEPVLTKINYLKGNKDLNLENKLYLALALTKLGDNENARQIYENEIKPSYKSVGFEIWPTQGNEREKNVKLVATIGILASYLGEKEDAEKIRSYIASFNPEDDLDLLEEAMLASNELKNINFANASFTYQTSLKNGDINLANGDVFALTLSADELKTINFPSIQGDIELISEYEISADPAGLKKNESLSLTRKYLVNNKEVDSLKEGDLVLVRLDPNILNNGLNGPYQVVDYLPSGLKPATRTYGLDIGASAECDPIWYPIQVIDNIVYFSIYKDFDKTKNCQNRTLNYYARVVNKGEYKVQPALIQSLVNTGVLNISVEKNISVK